MEGEEQAIHEAKIAEGEFWKAEALRLRGILGLPVPPVDLVEEHRRLDVIVNGGPLRTFKVPCSCGWTGWLWQDESKAVAAWHRHNDSAKKAR